MSQREIAELRRRFRPDRANITAVRGCYFNDKGEILSQFTQSVNLMLEDEKEKLLGVLKKTLSGTAGKNGVDLSFPTREVLEGEHHKLLTRLRNSRLEDEEAAQSLFEKIGKAVCFDSNYLILLAHDAYDVPFRGKDGAAHEEQSDQVFSYIVCCVCPVKLSKSALSYHTGEGAFHNSKTEWIVAQPEMGFLFPAFDNRSTNLYGAWYYTRDPARENSAFVDTVFGQEPPMTSVQQEENFRSVLGTALEEDCSLAVVQTIHAQLSDMIQEHKDSKEPEALLISRPEVAHVLKTAGVEPEKVEAFDKAFDGAFGEDVELRPQNLMDTRRFRLSTPQVAIQVDPAHKDLIETRVLGGIPYIMIRAEDGVEVNGVPIHIEE